MSDIRHISLVLGSLMLLAACGGSATAVPTASPTPIVITATFAPTVTTTVPPATMALTVPATAIPVTMTASLRPTGVSTIRATIRATTAPTTTRATSTTVVPSTAAGSVRVAPESAYTCPTGYPIKANLTTYDGEKIYHVPGSPLYNRTKPETCFATAADAKAAGFRASRI